MRIVDPDHKPVAPGEVGEVAVRGQNVMMGYWERPEETAKAVIDGWMHTGDGGYMDDEGYIYLVDRMKDMIISGGENVYSIEVENVVAQHPAVAQCAVIGIPDPQWGETVHAFVIPKAGAQRQCRRDHRLLQGEDRRLQMPAQRRCPQRAVPAVGRRQGAEARVAATVLGECGGDAGEGGIDLSLPHAPASSRANALAHLEGWPRTSSTSSGFDVRANAAPRPRDDAAAYGTPVSSNTSPS